VGAGEGANLARRLRRVVAGVEEVTPLATIPVTCDTSDRAATTRTRVFFSASAMDELNSDG
jgi:hypothetical protein